MFNPIRGCYKYGIAFLQYFKTYGLIGAGDKVTARYGIDIERSAVNFDATESDNDV